MLHFYQHFKRTGHSVVNLSVQTVAKNNYDGNSISRFKNIKIYQTELKWIKSLQTPLQLGVNEYIYQECDISKMPHIDVFSLLDIQKRKHRSHGLRKK